MNKDDVKYFADLARIEMPDGDLQKMAGEIGSILEYIDQIKNAPTKDADQSAGQTESRIENSSVRNVMREDENPYEKCRDTENLIKEAPNSENGLIKTKKIL